MENERKISGLFWMDMWQLSDLSDKCDKRCLFQYSTYSWKACAERTESQMVWRPFFWLSNVYWTPDQLSWDTFTYLNYRQAMNESISLPNTQMGLGRLLGGFCIKLSHISWNLNLNESSGVLNSTGSEYFTVCFKIFSLYQCKIWISPYSS